METLILISILIPLNSIILLFVLLSIIKDKNKEIKHLEERITELENTILKYRIDLLKNIQHGQN